MLGRIIQLVDINILTVVELETLVLHISRGWQGEPTLPCSRGGLKRYSSVHYKCREAAADYVKKGEQKD